MQKDWQDQFVYLNDGSIPCFIGGDPDNGKRLIDAAYMSKGKKAYVDIESVTQFYRGEEYHQNYLEKSRHY